MHSNFKDSR